MYNKSISLFDWRSDINLEKADAIGEDLILLEDPVIHSSFNNPFKVDITAVIICTMGSIEGNVNLKHFTLKAPALFVVLPHQILELCAYSRDFYGYYIIMSHQSVDRLTAVYIKNLHTLRNAVKNDPWTPLSKENMERMLLYFKAIQRIIRVEENIHRVKIAELLAQAIYLEIENVFHKSLKNEKKSKRTILTERFMDLLEHHYQKHRDVQFYADKLSLTPKYLSKIIHEDTGSTAIEWINNYVLLEAKALLKSTDLTIQQISVQLNFPSQSHFGKYFKNHTNLSPKEYRLK
jgi:AraC-like DNA-binding protein